MATDNAEDVEVRLVDQEKISEFGRLNNRLLETRAELKQSREDNTKLEDASAELMMVTNGKVMILIGETFIEVDEDYANEYCEKKQQALQSKIDELAEEEAAVVKRQEALKKELYARFGDSINLEY